MEKARTVPCLYRQLFEIHRSKLKPDTVCHLSQTSMLGVSHRVFLFCVRKHSFNRFFSHCVEFFAALCLANLLRHPARYDANRLFVPFRLLRTVPCAGSLRNAWGTCGRCVFPLCRLWYVAGYLHWGRYSYHPLGCRDIAMV